MSLVSGVSESRVSPREDKERGQNGYKKGENTHQENGEEREKGSGS